MEGFRAVFADLEDPRTGNAQRHDLLEILLIGLCTVLCGGETRADMARFGHAKRDFLQQFLTLKHGIPSHDTFSRVFRLLDPAQFHACFLGFMRRFADGCQGVLALDGKTLRGCFDRAAGASPLHLVSAWAVEQRLVLGQVAVDEKSNEITAVPQLLKMLSLNGVVVTADAMACQREIAAQITTQGGDYVLALKANQGTLFEDVQLFLDDPAVALAIAVTTDGEHGRIEVRQAALSTDIAWLQQHHAWPGLQAIGKVTAHRATKDKTSQETRYFPVERGRQPGALRRNRAGPLGRGKRAPLGFGCDDERGRAAQPQGPWPPTTSLSCAGWDNRYLATLLAQFAKIQMR